MGLDGDRLLLRGSCSQADVMGCGGMRVHGSVLDGFELGCRVCHFQLL